MRLWPTFVEIRFYTCIWKRRPGFLTGLIWKHMEWHDCVLGRNQFRNATAELLFFSFSRLFQFPLFVFSIPLRSTLAETNWRAATDVTILGKSRHASRHFWRGPSSFGFPRDQRREFSITPLTLNFSQSRSKISRIFLPHFFSPDRTRTHFRNRKEGNVWKHELLSSAFSTWFERGNEINGKQAIDDSSIWAVILLFDWLFVGLMDYDKLLHLLNHEGGLLYLCCGNFGIISCTI